MSNVRRGASSSVRSAGSGRGRRRWYAGLVLVAVLWVLTGCSTATDSAGSAVASGTPSAATTTSVPASPSGPPTSAVPAPTPLTPDSPAGTSTSGFLPPNSVVHTFVAVGDSVTAGSVAVEGDAAPGVGSWIQSAASAPLEYRGAWAVPGATTADMLAGVSAMRADSLVLLGGTNDLIRGADPGAALASLVAITRTVGIADVVLVAVPPLDPNPSAAVALNQRLVALAAQQGWRFVDPWQGLGEDGAYLPGATMDGVHPTPEGADLVGTRIRSTLLYGG